MMVEIPYVAKNKFKVGPRKWKITFWYILRCVLKVVETSVVQDKPATFPILPRTALVNKNYMYNHDFNILSRLPNRTNNPENNKREMELRRKIKGKFTEANLPVSSAIPLFRVRRMCTWGHHRSRLVSWKAPLWCCYKLPPAYRRPGPCRSWYPGSAWQTVQLIS